MTGGLIPGWFGNLGQQLSANPALRVKLRVYIDVGALARIDCDRLARHADVPDRRARIGQSNSGSS